MHRRKGWQAGLKLQVTSCTFQAARQVHGVAGLRSNSTSATWEFFHPCPQDTPAIWTLQHATPLFANQVRHDTAGVGRAPVFPNVNSLPGAESQAPLPDRD